MRAGTADGEGDLHEAVGVHWLALHVQVQAGVDERALGEVERGVVARVHRHVFVGHVLAHARTIRQAATPVS